MTAPPVHYHVHVSGFMPECTRTVLELSRPMPARTFCTKNCHPAAAGSVPYMHFFTRQHHSVSRECGGFTFVSVRASACLFNRFASGTMSCRRLPVFVFVAAVQNAYRTSANGGVPSKKLSVPFCLVSCAIFRLRTSTRSLASLLMPFLRHEISEAVAPKYSVAVALTLPLPLPFVHRHVF